MTDNSSPLPTPVPVPTPTPHYYNLPNYPANTYHLLSNLADAIDATNTKLITHVGKLADINQSTDNAVSEVAANSKGQATDALSNLWSDSRIDMARAHDPLLTLTTPNSGMGPGPYDFRSILYENKAAIQTGLLSLAKLQHQQSSSAIAPVSLQQLEQWKQDVDTLDGAIGNVNMAVMILAMAINQLNNGFYAHCTTGLTPGGTLPLFTTHAFAHQANSTPGSGSGNITEQDLKDEIQAKGGDQEASTFIPLLADDRLINLDSIKALLDTGVDPNQIYTWLMDDNGYQITNDTIKETTANVNLLVSRGGDATESANWVQGLDADQLAALKNRAAQCPHISITKLKDLVDPPKLEYDSNPKHDVIRPGVGPQPTDPLSALKNSVTYKSTSSNRVTIDPETDEIVVLDDTNNGKYHGHVETWNQLDQFQQNTLMECGFIDSRGRIIVRDIQGNITRYGKNVIKGK